MSPYALDTPGGVQQQVIGLVDQLRQRGEQAYAVAPGAGRASDRIDVGGWIGVPVNQSRAPLALSPRVIGRVASAIAPADVIHIHEPLVPLVGWAALRARRPTVVTFHADPSRAVRAAYRLGSPILHRLFRGRPATAVSRVAERAIAPLGLEPERIPNAVDVASFRTGDSRNPSQVAFVGRPDPRKGRDLLLAAWPAVRSRLPDAELMIVGGGAETPVPGVSYLGRVSEQEKRAVLATSAVFCAPNRGGESFGITIAEGMAAGCAIVASDLDAFEDVLAGTGRMFANGDRSALAEALIRVLSEPDLRHRLATEGSIRVRAFDWEAVTDRYLTLYRKALAG